MGTRNNPGRYDCYARAEDDEPLFTLLGRDPHAAGLVALWAALRAMDNHGARRIFEKLLDNHQPWKLGSADKIAEALNVADAMKVFRKARLERRQ